MVAPRVQQVVALARRKGLLRPRDLDEIGLARQYLRMATERGLVQRVGRGLYRVPGAMVTERISEAEVCKRVPGGAICLISALHFHGLTTQIPHYVWLAIDGKAAAPRIDTVAVRIVRFSGKALTEGVDVHDVEGVPVPVYNPAKTVADCFKYRNKIGIDVAVEALREGLRQRKATVDHLVHYVSAGAQNRPVMGAW